jgi:hypothetical protein
VITEARRALSPRFFLAIELSILPYLAENKAYLEESSLPIPGLIGRGHNVRRFPLGERCLSQELMKDTLNAYYTDRPQTLKPRPVQSQQLAPGREGLLARIEDATLAILQKHGKKPA